MGAGGGRCWPEGLVESVPWTQPPGDIDNRREKGALTGTHRGYRRAALAVAAPAAPTPSPSFSSCCRCGSSLPPSLPPHPTSSPPPPGPGQRAEAPPAGNVSKEPPAEPQRGRCRFDGTGPRGRIVRPPPLEALRFKSGREA
ncbi:hypothetical protein PAL_GLEAN10009890 [Pteropus alecto]|uniref:Uncharacterized protein n=1 Tax=Pteropus alecto TaxID=9402 RepID=L5KE59_PTEAL|nr:hypothetical protein PAL_GLEAN10009890 [Pteropus alecto]